MKKKTYRKKINERVDIFLAQELSISREKIKSLIKNKLILVNDEKTKPSYELQYKDIIKICNIQKETEKTNIKATLNILYEDKDIIIINKNKGLIIHPIEDEKIISIASLLENYTKNLSNLNGSNRKGIVHRLDKETEGVLLVAKHNKSHKWLKDQFQNRTIVKKYYAMIKGNMVNDYKEINKPIVRHKSKGIFKIANNNEHNKKDATSYISVLKRYKTKTLVSVEIKTGRTHQIRVHLSSIGHPVLGDPLYGKPRGKNLRLQAYYISFYHAGKNKQFTIKLPLSGELV